MVIYLSDEDIAIYKCSTSISCCACAPFANLGLGDSSMMSPARYGC